MISCRLATLHLLAGLMLASSTRAAAQSRRAAPPIDMQVAIERGAPGHLTPQWAKLLDDIGLSGVRLRSARPNDQPSVESVESAGAKRYRVVALLSSRNELVLPGGKFGLSDRARLKQFLLDLPARNEEATVERGRYGLTKVQFERLFGELSKVTTASTRAMKPALVVPQLTQSLTTPVVFDAGAETALRRAKPLTQELKGASTGTTLAAALREVGLAFVPEAPLGKPMRLRVATLENLKESWPVGWRPEGVGRQVAPAMHQSKEIEIAGYTLQAALTALERPLGAPIVYDQLILGRRKLDPAAVQVKLPRRRSTIRRAVDRILSQARLAGELRVDEAGRPFYWVTQYGKDSARATN